MTINFTVEEITALSTANQPNRIAAITFFSQGLPFYSEEEKDPYNFANELINKLKAITDSQYTGLNFDTAIDITAPPEKDE